MKYLICLYGIINLIISGAFIGKWYLQYQHNFPGVDRYPTESEIIAFGFFLSFGILIIAAVIRTENKIKRILEELL